MTVRVYSVDEVMADEKKLKQFYAKCVLLTDIVSEYISGNNTLKCPFHDDRTPSAKLYTDLDGSQRIYCFTEKKAYTSFDYVSKIMKVDPKRFLLQNYGISELESEAVKIDFDRKEKFEETLRKQEIDLILEVSKKELPNITRYLNKTYPHGIEV